MNPSKNVADRPALGIILMIVGVGFFAVMDAAIKWLSSDYSTMQITALRSWFGLPFLTLMVYFDGGIGSLKTQRPGAHFIRYLLVLFLSLGFFWVLSQMKLVDVIAITFASPIMIAALSVPVLKESVGVHRWSAILIGFIGILVILRPGAGVFQWAAIVAVGCSALYSILMVTTRALKSTESRAALMYYPQLGMSITGILFVPFFWQTPNLPGLALFALAGALGSIGIFCLTNAVRLAPVATVSPFEYTALIWATILGYIFWQELPDQLTLFGTAIVISSGLYILYRETIKSAVVQPKAVNLTPDNVGSL